MHHSGLWFKIKEFQIKWNESEEKGSKFEELSLVGTKFVFLRRPIDKNNKRQVNFLPIFKEDTYLIKGTQIIPIDLNSNPDHVLMDNFEFSDFQFRGKLLNSGFKIYCDQENQSYQNRFTPPCFDFYLLFQKHICTNKPLPPLPISSQKCLKQI